MERHQVKVHLRPHDVVVSAMTMEAIIEVFDRTKLPVYEPMVYSKVCDICEEYGYKHDVSPFDFLRTLALLEMAHHIRRVRRLEKMTGEPSAPHVMPTRSGRNDSVASKELLRKVVKSCHG